MIKSTEMSRYTHKTVIDLGKESKLTACFNDGKGHWDSRNGGNYSFKSGIYTYSNGKITRVGDNDCSFGIPYFKSGCTSPSTEKCPINLRAESANGSGTVNYIFKAKHEDGVK